LSPASPTAARLDADPLLALFPSWRQFFRPRNFSMKWRPQRGGVRESVPLAVTSLAVVLPLVRFAPDRGLLPKAKFSRETFPRVSVFPPAYGENAFLPSPGGEPFSERIS